MDNNCIYGKLGKMVDGKESSLKLSSIHGPEHGASPLMAELGDQTNADTLLKKGSPSLLQRCLSERGRASPLLVGSPHHSDSSSGLNLLRLGSIERLSCSDNGSPRAVQEVPVPIPKEVSTLVVEK